MSRSSRSTLRAVAAAAALIAVLGATSACGSSSGSSGDERTATVAQADSGTSATSTPGAAPTPTDGWTGGWTGRHHVHADHQSPGASDPSTGDAGQPHSAGEALQQALAAQPHAADGTVGPDPEVTGSGPDAGSSAQSSARTPAPADSDASSSTTSTASTGGAARSTPPSSAAGSPSTSPSTAAAMRSFAYRSPSASPSPASTSQSSGSTSTSSSLAAGVSGPWLSGASGTGVADGSYGTWRGDPVQIAGTWADSDAGQTAVWSLQQGGEYGSWNKSIDIAIGAIDKGETWSAAAGGAYDARWTQSLNTIKSAWGSRTGTVYIRFAHEMNGNWYPWSVNASNYQDFDTAWKRFRALQQQIFPQSKLVFSLNRQDSGNGIAWTKTFPGAQYVDVIGTDSYNNWPTITNAADWAKEVNSTQSDGAPQGIGAYLAFAKSVGLPLAVPEWSGRASMGDDPYYVQAMHDFFAAHGGTGAGQLLYEIQFNCDMDSSEYQFYGPAAHMPASAAEYVKDF